MGRLEMCSFLADENTTTANLLLEAANKVAVMHYLETAQRMLDGFPVYTVNFAKRDLVPSDLSKIASPDYQGLVIDEYGTEVKTPIKPGNEQLKTTPTQPFIKLPEDVWVPPLGQQEEYHVP